MQVKQASVGIALRTWVLGKWMFMKLFSLLLFMFEYIDSFHNKKLFKMDTIKF